MAAQVAHHHMPPLHAHYRELPPHHTYAVPAPAQVANDQLRGSIGIVNTRLTQSLQLCYSQASLEQAYAICIHTELLPYLVMQLQPCCCTSCTPASLALSSLTWVMARQTLRCALLAC